MKPSSSQKKAFTKVCSYYYSESSPRHEMLHNMKFHHRNATPSPSNCLNTRSPSAISQDSLDSPWPKLALQAKLLCRAAPFELGTCQILCFPFRSRHERHGMGKRINIKQADEVDHRCIFTCREVHMSMWIYMCACNIEERESPATYDDRDIKVTKVE
jgi:hypothetical protein